MAEFPDSPLECTFEVAWGADLTAEPNTWEFTDHSDRLIENPITVSQGVVVGTGTSKTASANGIPCLNDDGWLTPFLATSPYHPNVDVGTPARLSIRTNTTPYLSDTFGRTVASGNWGTSDDGHAWSASASLSVTGGKGLIAPVATNILYRSVTALTHRDVDVTFDASIAAVSTGASTVLGPVLRSNTGITDYIWAGLEYDPGGSMRWTIRTYEASVDTIRQQVAVPDVTYGPGTAVAARVVVIGDRLRARAWLAADPEPTTWTADVILPVLTAADDRLGMQALAVGGNTNVLPNPFSVDNLTVQQPKYARIEGYLTGVQPSFRPLADGTVHSVAQISIGGIGSRLERRQADEVSALRRSIEKAPVPPIAYWHGEDKEAATSAASAFPNQPAMVVTGPAVFGVEVGRFELGDADQNLWQFGASSVVSLAAGAKLSGAVPATSSTEWTVSMLHQSSTPAVGGGVTAMRLMEWATPSGTHQRWALIGTTTGYVVRAYNDAAGTTTDVATYGSSFPQLLHYSVTGTQNGGNVDVQLLMNANVVGSGSVAGTIGAPIRVAANPDQANTTASTSPTGIRFLAGQITVHNSVVVSLPFYTDGDTGYLPRADRAWAYEAAHRRGERLAGEDRVAWRTLGDPYTTGVTLLNAQRPGAFQQLLTQAIDSESGGLLYEGEFGYIHDPRTNRFNRAVSLTVDMSTYRYTGGTDPTQVLVPKLDARGPNIWTVERNNGSAATYAAAEAYRVRRGDISDKAVLDVLRDADTGQHAAFRTHLNVDGQGANYPATTIDLAANPGLIDDWLLCTIGSRIQRTNQPTIAGLGVIDQVLDGISETFTPRSAGGPGWTATCDTSPAQVWDTAVYDDGDRWDSASTTLGQDVDDDTVLAFSTVNKDDLWAIDDGYYDVEIAGQTDTVLWVSLAGTIGVLDGGFETGLTGWTASGVTLVQSALFAHTGLTSAQLTVTGSPGSASTFPTTPYPVTVGASYTAYAWVYATTTVNNVRLNISWYTAAVAFISSSTGSTISLGAGVWTLLTVTGTAPGTAAGARPIPHIHSSPANGTVMYVDDVDMVADAAVSGPGPYVQQAWVTRDPVVVKALSAGEPIHVAEFGGWAL